MGVFLSVGLFSGAVAATLINDVLKGSFTCYVFKEGEEGLEMITFDYKGKGGG